MGLTAVGGAEIVRSLIVPNVKTYGELVLKDILSGSGTGSLNEEVKKREADIMLEALVTSLKVLEDKEATTATVGAGKNVNGSGDLENGAAAEIREALTEKVGSVVAERVIQTGRITLAKVVLDA